MKQDYSILLLGGFVLLAYLAKRKTTAGVGRPYQTYLRFDQFENPAAPVTPAPAPVLPDLPAPPVYEDDDPFDEDIAQAADQYAGDLDLQDAMTRGRRNPYVDAYNAYYEGAQVAEEYRFYDLSRQEASATVDAAANDYAVGMKNFDIAYEAFVAGAWFTINKNSYLW